jgi:precorrin-2 dehydrogenase/sirohydrochlorin ferrochelatase
VNAYLPIALKIQGWRCLVVGGGVVAARRAESLLESNAIVTVAAPALCESLLLLAESGRIDHIAELYDAHQLDGIRLVIAATDQPDVNAAVARDAAARRILVNDADDPERGDFVIPAVVRRGDLLISVTTLGSSPSIAKRLRDELAAAYGPEWSDYTALLREIRIRVLAEVEEPARRKQALTALAADESLLELIREGRADEARARALACISPSSD